MDEKPIADQIAEMQDALRKARYEQNRNTPNQWWKEGLPGHEDDRVKLYTGYGDDTPTFTAQFSGTLPELARWLATPDLLAACKAQQLHGYRMVHCGC